MTETLAAAFVYALGLYLAIGVAIGVPFVIFGVQRIDPSAVGATRGFRATILPGAIALWPFVLRRWRSGESRPRAERNAHRDAAGPRKPQ
jgi:hypothetical protein